MGHVYYAPTTLYIIGLHHTFYAGLALHQYGLSQTTSDPQNRDCVLQSKHTRGVTVSKQSFSRPQIYPGKIAMQFFVKNSVQGRKLSARIGFSQDWWNSIIVSDKAYICYCLPLQNWKVIKTEYHHQEIYYTLYNIWQNNTQQ